jgi:NADH:ubiquinone oxidoreductase subunit 2 (subunit N)
LILIIATAYYLVLLEYLNEESFIIYSHMFLISYYILIIKIIVTFISVIILWLSLLFLKNIKTKNTLEFPIAFIYLILNTLVFISSFNLLSMYITFEILAITLYILSVSGYRCKISLVGYFYREVYKSFWSIIRKEWRKGKGRR